MYISKQRESPFLRKAWASMGADNPDDWVALEYEKAKQLDEYTESG